MIETHVNYSPMRGAFELWVTDRVTDRVTDLMPVRGLARPLVFDAVEPGTSQGCEPTLRLDDTGAQQLMDTLYAAGVRPTNVGSAGQLAAVERHLADMRALVASYATMKLP